MKIFLERIVVMKTQSQMPWNDVLFFDKSTQSYIFITLDCIYDLRSISAESTSTLSSTKRISNSFFGVGDKSQPFQKYSLSILVSNCAGRLHLEHLGFVGAQVSQPLVYDQLYQNRMKYNLSHQQMTIPPPGYTTKLPILFQESVTFVTHRKQ